MQYNMCMAHSMTKSCGWRRDTFLFAASRLTYCSVASLPFRTYADGSISMLRCSNMKKHKHQERKPLTAL